MSKSAAIPKKIKNIILTSLAAGYVFLAFAWLQLPDQRFHIYFLDIGQGDSIFIKTPQNHQILIDGGPRSIVIEELADVMPFFDKSLDMIVLTHPHADHLDGLVEVLKRYEAQNVLFSGVEYSSRTYEEFLEELAWRDLRVFVAESETDFIFGDVLMDVVYPIRQIAGETLKNVNNASVSTRISYDKVTILLTGDLEEDAEAELLASGAQLQADVFKAGHHGSRTSSTEALLRHVQPEIVVIQTGEGNSYGHPHPETLDKLEALGAKVFRNDLDGRVEFIF